MDTLERAINLRAERKKNQKPKDTVIRDLRVYYDSLPSKALYSYDYRYAEIFLNILRNKNLMCPVYHHLYIQVADTIEEALTRSIPFLKEYICGVATVDYSKYPQKNEGEKDQIVFNAITTGLKDIAEIDGLDMYIIDSTIEEIKLSGLNTELVHLTAENKIHTASVTYFSRSMEEGNPIYLNISEKLTGKSGKIQIGEAGKDQ